MRVGGVERKLEMWFKFQINRGEVLYIKFNIEAMCVFIYMYIQ